MAFTRSRWLALALGSSVLAGALMGIPGTGSAGRAHAQAAPSAPTPPNAANTPAPAPSTQPAVPAPAPPPSGYAAPPPDGYAAPANGYPTAPPAYYAPGYAPSYAPQPPGYYGVEGPSPGYGQPTYQAVQGRRPGPGSHEHEGFYLHLGTGIGAGGASYRERIEGRSAAVKTRGIAVTFDVAVGGRLVDNFILHGDFSLTFFNAKKLVDDVEDNGYDSIDSTLWLLGIGGTYYFMPTNLYLTLVVGTGGFTESRKYDSFEEDRVSIESSAGGAGSLAIGKEWWVGGRGEWGIGAAIRGLMAVAPIEVSDLQSTAIGHSITLEFSATLN